MEKEQKITRENISRMIDEKLGIKHDKNVKDNKDKNDRTNKTKDNNRWYCLSR